MSDFCPLIKKKCKEHSCKFYIQVLGKNPQTGQDVSEYNCAVSWLPMLLIEGSQQTRQTGSAIESFRNEMVKANENPLLNLQNNNGQLTGVTWPEVP
jgi:hypothetical protein